MNRAISWMEAVGLLTKTLCTPTNTAILAQTMDDQGTSSLPINIHGHTAFLERTKHGVTLDKHTLAKMDDNNPEISINQVLELINGMRALMGQGEIDTNIETWSPLR